MITTLIADDWQRLAKAVKDGNCTPFIGAGASHPPIDLGATIARRWAEKHKYPLPDSGDLLRVAQYMALNPEGSIQDPLFPKQEFVDYLKTCGLPDFDAPDEPYRGLAGLPLSLYLTTNYDGFMLEALKRASRDPRMEYCRWTKQLQEDKPLLDRAYVPSVKQPLVYHLHGTQDRADSLVLTEDDYVDFIVSTSKDLKKIPSFVKAALTDHVLLFLGYSLSDWNFRVLFRSLQEYRGKSTRRGHVAVQLEPGGLSEENLERAVKFLHRYFGSQHIVVFFGHIKVFVKTLRQWVELENQKTSPMPSADASGSRPHAPV
jgi:hypothetical protein